MSVLEGPADTAAGIQSEVIAFLRDPASYPDAIGEVECIETHSAMVFLAGPWAFKIKRAVRFDYLDFSTLERRHTMCRRELEINRRTAPQIYDRVVPVTREPDGTLRLGGAGQAIEWALRMHRFEQNDLLSATAARGDLDDALINALARHIADFHRGAERATAVDETARLTGVVSDIARSFRSSPDAVPPGLTAEFSKRVAQLLEETAPRLAKRAAYGAVRLCHGDLHLNNIVVLDGAPVLFDAIEFNSEIAEIDTLYDLVFLIMDLDQRGFRRQANLLLNRYLYHTGTQLDLEGLAALPLFLACRAGIRAMVEIQRGHQIQGRERTEHFAAAADYAGGAVRYLRTRPPRLVAVGGFSGSGKTTLARSLAPLFEQAPGAIHLRSDLERKALFNVEETERLGADCYTAQASAKVYRRLLEKAECVLAAGHTVIVDAVFAHDHEREQVEGIAEGLNLRFDGVWLDAPGDELRARVDGRVGDASDATSEIVDAQIGRGAGSLQWHQIDAADTPQQTLEAAKRVLTLD